MSDKKQNKKAAKALLDAALALKHVWTKYFSDFSDCRGFVSNAVIPL